MGIVNWRQVVQDRDGWRRLTFPSWVVEPQKKIKKKKLSMSVLSWNTHWNMILY